MTPHHLTEEQRTHFIEHGWLCVPQAIPRENIERFAGDVWVRTGYDKDDISTWAEERVFMSRHKEMQWKDFAPKAWAAVCEIVGGENRIDQSLYCRATDSMIANFGKEGYRDQIIEPKALGNWHIDGNWFKHFLDSSEHSVLCIVLFTDVKSRAGGTYICEDGLTETIHWLHERPQGCDPKFVDLDGSCIFDNLSKWSKYVELTGKAGDMFICHGAMPHSASKNHLRAPRLITSPRFVLKEPLSFNRSNPEEYSLVELKTLHDLGVSSLPSWKINGERERFTSHTKNKREGRVLEELERMKKHAEETDGLVDSIHVNGLAEFHGWKEGQRTMAA